MRCAVFAAPTLAIHLPASTSSFTSAGAARSAEVAVSSGSGAGSPSVGIDDQGEVAVGWSVSGSDPAVWARGLNPDGTGTARLAGQVLSRDTAGKQARMVVSESPWGQVAVAYTDDTDGNSFDQAIFGLGATNSDW